MAAIYTLLYIAPAEEAEAIALGDHPLRHLPGIWLNHVGDLELAALWSVAAAEPSQAEGTIMAELLFQAAEEGPFVIRVPHAFVQTVAAIDDAHLQEVAAKWGQTEALSKWHLQELAGVVKQLRDFGRRALESSDPVLQVAAI
jgi:hypothetical protein